MSNVNDGMEGGPDPAGSCGPGSAFPTGMMDGDGDGIKDSGGVPGGGSDVMPPAGTSTSGQPRPEDFV